MRERVPLLRGLATLAVLVGHAGLYAQDPLLPPLGQSVALTGVDRWVYSLLGTPTQLSDFAVPGFFVIAGLLGAGAQGASRPVRAAALLGPLLLWSVVAVAVTAGVGNIPGPLGDFLWGRLLMGQVEWGYAIPLALVQCALLAPLLADACARRPVAALGVAFGVQMLAVALRLAGSFGGVFDTLPGLGSAAGNFVVWRWCGWFVGGLVLGAHPVAARAWLAGRRPLLWGLTLLGLALALLEAEFLPTWSGDAGWIASQHRPGSTLYALGFLGLFFAAPRTPGRWVDRVEALGRVAFPLWLLHPIVYRVAHRALLFLGADTVRAHPLLMAGGYVLGAAVPLVVVTLFLSHRLPRPLFRRIFGH
jgi:hypothetical protein